MSQKYGNGNINALGQTNNADRSVNTSFNKLFIGGKKTAGGFNVKSNPKYSF